MPALESRITAPEACHQRAAQLTIIYTVVDRGSPHPDCNYIEAGPQEWMRQPGETETEFVARACREVTRNHSTTQFIASEVHHATH